MFNLKISDRICETGIFLFASKFNYDDLNLCSQSIIKKAAAENQNKQNPSPKQKKILKKGALTISSQIKIA